MAKTLAQITDEIVQAIISNFAPRQIDTRVGTVVKEALVNPVAAQLKTQSDAVDTIALNQSVSNASSMTTQAMDDLAENTGVQRFIGLASTGTVRFVKFVAPLSDIEIPAGTRVATGATNSSSIIIFKTLSAVTMTPTSPSDPVTGAAASVDVLVQAEVSGSAGNVDANTVTTLLDAVPGIDQIYNPSAFSAGADSQSNTEMAAAVKARSQGNLGTRPGYKGTVVSNFSVQDCIVLGNQDSGLTRNQFGGAVDIIVLGSDIISTTESYAWTGQSSITPASLPLVSVSSLTGVSGGSPVTFTAGTDYTVQLDTSGPYAGSFIEQAKIVLHFTTATPDTGSLLTVTYENNQLIREIQAYLGGEDSDVLGSDVLVKAGIQISTNVTASIKVIPGFSSAAVVSAAQAAVNDFFSTKLLGVEIDISQIIDAIGETPGVSFVDIPSFSFALASAPGVPLQKVVARNQEYVRATTVTINTL